MICVDPDLRLDANQVLCHPWIAMANDLPEHNVTSVSNIGLRYLVVANGAIDNEDDTTPKSSGRGNGSGKRASIPSVSFGQKLITESPRADVDLSLV